jgi:hypothetical protein
MSGSAAKARAPARPRSRTRGTRNASTRRPARPPRLDPQEIGNRTSEIALLLNLATARGELGDNGGAELDLREAARIRGELDDAAQRPKRWRDRLRR